MSPDVTELVQALLDRVAAADPVVATQLGMSAHAGELADYSPVAVAAYLADVKALLARLDEATGALGDDGIDAVTGGQIARRVVRALETRRVHCTDPGLYLDAAYGVLLLMIKEIGTPAERVEAIAGRLRALPGLFEQGLSNLDDALPLPYLQSALNDVAGMRELVGEAAPQFAAELGFGGLLDEPARRAADAVERFGDQLTARFLPNANAGVGAGRDLLAEILEQEHLLEETPEQIAAYGRAVMADTRAAMAELASSMGHGDVEAAIRAVKADHPAQADLLRSYREALTAARAYLVEYDLVTLAPGEELIVEPTPAPLRASLPFAAYESPGPFEAQQRGRYWVSLPAADLPPDRLERALAEHPFASMPTVGVHEAYPGHHTQLSRANQAPTLARRIGYIPDGGTLLIEGWAFYCEEMMETQGFLAAPGVRLMRLNDQLWRACRVVIDVELNLGVMGFEQAVDFLSTGAHIDRHFAELEVETAGAAPTHNPPPHDVAQGVPRRTARLGRDDARAHPEGHGAVGGGRGRARPSFSPTSGFAVVAQACVASLRA
jgi:uncharacterized protein (DUF885 family)